MTLWTHKVEIRASILVDMESKKVSKEELLKNIKDLLHDYIDEYLTEFEIVSSKQLGDAREV